MKININNFSKSELKDYVHKNGYFSQAMMNSVGRDQVNELLKKSGVTNAMNITDSIPQGENIFIYNGVVSQRYGKGEKNRNGYKISADGWLIDEYMYNPAILLMHDPEKGVIGNMVSMRTNEEGLNSLFWVDVNNISDAGIKNQIMTGTLKATSTGSLVEEYEFEDMDGNSMGEERAIEKYGERELFLAYMGSSDKLVLNITKSVLLEVSMVTLGSNYKAVHSDTMSNYFSNLLSNKMTPEQIEELRLKNAVDTTEKEVEIPEGVEAQSSTDEVELSENDTQPEEVTTEEVVETNEEATYPETTDEVEEDEVTDPTEEVETTTEEVVAEPTELQNALNKIEELQNKIKSLEDEINTPVSNNKLAKGTQPEAIDPNTQVKNFFTNVVWKTKI